MDLPVPLDDRINVATDLGTHTFECIWYNHKLVFFLILIFPQSYQPWILGCSNKNKINSWVIESKEKKERLMERKFWEAQDPLESSKRSEDPEAEPWK